MLKARRPDRQMEIETPLLSTRRQFLGGTVAASLAVALPGRSFAAMSRLDRPVQMGLIADLHHDVMHDGFRRMEAFVKAMESTNLDAILQLGDFAYPSDKNSEVISLFNRAHDLPLHVIGNHDTDSGHTKQQCLDVWGMVGRYYSQDVSGLRLLVLDGNDAGSPKHQGGYPSYVGEEQVDWLKAQLANHDGPIIVVSHQPLAGAWAVDNAEQIQAILGEAADKVLIAINGHSHIDQLLRVKDVTYLHVNSASYQWVGSEYKHQSYSESIHAGNPWISHTCPYRDSLFATLTVDPNNLQIRIEGRETSWVGKSPAELGKDLDASLTNGEEVAPRIRNRMIERISG